jgi:uracil phosphoribosyltransferase
MAGAGNALVPDHALLKHKLTLLRDARTDSRLFRDLAEELTLLLAYEATRDLPLRPLEVDTPVARARGYALAKSMPALVPILRAGLWMVGGVSRLLPGAPVGYLGMYRDPKTLEPVEYYCNLPPQLGARTCLVLDPMLATGGSAVAAARSIAARGCNDIKLLCLIAAPEGLARLADAAPNVRVFAAAIDERLNDHGYIVPGLGDAGDRLAGTCD